MVGNVTSRQAWERLAADGESCLVDVRTDAEWTYVGLPDLSPLGKEVVLISWQHFPSGAIDPGFVSHLRRSGVAEGQPVYFICRSGARSQSAAIAAERAGFTDVHNVSDGFEGPHDSRQRRGLVCGWKHADLPWRQG